VPGAAKALNINIKQHALNMKSEVVKRANAMHTGQISKSDGYPSCPLYGKHNPHKKCEFVIRPRLKCGNSAIGECLFFPMQWYLLHKNTIDSV
jgi:hypothetical protein